MWGFFNRIHLKSTVCKCLLAVGIGLTIGLVHGQTMAEVKLSWKTQAGGSVTTLLETTGYTNATATSPALPTITGYRFTHWVVTPSNTPNFVNRNRFGRALKRVSVVPKEDTTLTAVYEAETLDQDADDIADADEIYWYGSLTQTGTSDTDHDGYTFAQELQYGLDPHLPNALVYGGIRHGDSAIFWYESKFILALYNSSESRQSLYANYGLFETWRKIDNHILCHRFNLWILDAGWCSSS